MKYNYEKTRKADDHLNSLQNQLPPKSRSEKCSSFQEDGEMEEDGVLSCGFLLDYVTKRKLAELFDVPTDPTKDWRGLAKKLNLHSYIQVTAYII